MARFTLSVIAATLLTGAVWAQQADETPAAQPETPAPALGVFADVDGDGIPNHADEDFVRRGNGRGNGPPAFVDADGDGINDLAPDADGDGIPNHLDPDYERTPMANGSGRGAAAGGARRGIGNGPRGFVDEDGDGINDLAPDTDGDGIRNGVDPDYQRPGIGQQGRAGDGQKAPERGESGRGGRGRDEDGNGSSETGSNGNARGSGGAGGRGRGSR